MAAIAGTACALLAGSLGASATSAQVTNEALVSFVGPKKLKPAKTIVFNFRCSVACNLTVSSGIQGPRAKGGTKESGSLPAGALGSSGGSPNGALLGGLKQSPGRYKLKVKIVATDPATGAVDTDERTYGFK